MKNLLIITALLFFAPVTYAWDFSAKADVQRSSTDNVNLTNTSPISDTYSALSGSLQTQDDIYRIRLKGKTEKYNKTTENDNYSLDLSLRYKLNATNNYTVAIFKQVYSGVPLVTTDATSDNTGGRLSTSFLKDFNEETAGYLVLDATYIKYSKLGDRNDKIIGASLGLEHSPSATVLFNPELVVGKNSSTDSYYQTIYYGTNLLLAYNPSESWEFFVDGSYVRTDYTDRTVTKIVRNRTTLEEENQILTSFGIGASYTIAKVLPLQVKYSTANNSSNNSESTYKGGILSFGIGLQF